MTSLFSSIHPSWNTTILTIQPNILNTVRTNYEKDIQTKTVYPPIENIFSFTFKTPLDKVRVIIIGQDPYHGESQATGLAFSVPTDKPIPPSLKNIFKNQKKFNQIKNIPTSGCLDKWASQGVLLINSALTVVEGKPNSHQDMWKYFFNQMLMKITEHREKLIFVIFGGDAFSKLDYVHNKDGQFYTISSHPSPLGANSRLSRKGVEYPCFNECDHFGFVNKCIEENELGVPIDWNLE